MNEIPLGALFGVLVVLVVCSAFFSSAETGMMALNRYRLRHLARHQGHRGAQRASRLLERPDRLIGLILLGNNFVNILASSVATLIALRLYGEAGVAVAAGAMTLVILIFAEVAPKTLAALHPERVAFPAAWVLEPLLRITQPVVATVNLLANGVLWALRAPPAASARSHTLSREELRTVVKETSPMVSPAYQRMLLSVLDLEKVTVEDIMVPRNEIHGIDLDDPAGDILDQLLTSQHTRLPLYRGDIDQIVGMLHLRRLLAPMSRERFDRELLATQATEPYFVPEGTPLSTQLRNFQAQHERVGLVVDEYGDIEGLVTIDDLLEEIVGEFTTDPADASPDVNPQSDGTFLVEGSANLREINRAMGWEFPTDGPKTLNGLVLEFLERIPEAGTSLLIAGHPVEIVHTAGNAVKTARVKPRLRRAGGEESARNGT